jgi:tetratricopeptide (TPR) repeat protein
MRKLLLAVLVLLVAPHVSAQEYGHYDLKRLIASGDPADRKQAEATPPDDKYHALDVAYLDQMMDDLSIHAKNYPPRFDTPEDKQRAIKDATALSGVLDILLQDPATDPELLLRAAYVNSIGHNLDIPGTGNKADTIFTRLLEVTPSEPRANYAYGSFLAGAGRALDAVPYLEKALALGASDAAYGLGFAYLTLGNQEQALKYLEQYSKGQPGNADIERLIQAIKDGKLQLKRGKIDAAR